MILVSNQDCQDQVDDIRDGKIDPVNQIDFKWTPQIGLWGQHGGGKHEEMESFALVAYNEGYSTFWTNANLIQRAMTCLHTIRCFLLVIQIKIGYGVLLQHVDKTQEEQDLQRSLSVITICCTIGIWSTRYQRRFWKVQSSVHMCQTIEVTPHERALVSWLRTVMETLLFMFPPCGTWTSKHCSFSPRYGVVENIFNHLVPIELVEYETIPVQLKLRSLPSPLFCHIYTFIDTRLCNSVPINGPRRKLNIIVDRLHHGKGKTMYDPRRHWYWIDLIFLLLL